MPKSKSKTKRQSVAVPGRSSESERKINKLLSKIDRSKKPWEQEQTGFSDDELECLLEKLIPIKPFEKQTLNAVKTLRRQNETIWRTFLYGMLISEIQERERRNLNSIWPEWKDEYYKNIRKKLIAAVLDPKYKRNRRYQRVTTVDSDFNWLEPHTIYEYADAIAVNFKTIERFLKSITAKPSTPARGPYAQQYSPTVGLEIFKVWLTKPGWLTVDTLKESFPVNKKRKIKQPGKAGLRCQLGVELLRQLHYGDGDEKLKEKFRSIIHAKLPGCKDAWLKDLEHIKETSGIVPFPHILPIN